MNIRKNIDYSLMFDAMRVAMSADMSQIKLYCELGRLICQRTEKGAAVAAAEYLQRNYPDVPGLSPRNLRRMRDFYRVYEENPELLDLAMEIGWTQNWLRISSNSFYGKVYLLRIFRSRESIRSLMHPCFSCIL